MRREPLAGDRRGTLVALGLGTGIFAAFTVIFASWAGGIGLAIVISSRIQRHPLRTTLLNGGTYGLSCLAGFVLAILPAAGNVSYFFPFVLGILADNQRPGQGLLLQNFVSFVKEYPALAGSTAVFMLLLVIAHVRHRRGAAREPADWSLAAGLSLQIVALLGAILLGRFGNQFYFLALAAIIPVLALAVLEIYESHVALRRIVIFLVMVGLPLSLRSEMQTHDGFATYIARIVHEQTLGIQRYKDQAPASANPVIVYSFGTYSACGSLWHGNSFASGVFTEDLAGICPNDYLYFRDNANLGQPYEFQTYRVRTPLGQLEAEAVKWDIFLGCQEMVNSPLLKKQPISVYKTARWIGVCPALRKAEPLIVAYRR